MRGGSSNVGNEDNDMTTGRREYQSGGLDSRFHEHR